ncbi:MAG: decarboxylating 6-phosphogluconate dehydrogenase [Deltaproteobacteria bacterium]|nr:decarboxylating 6-phosphogluconate dehydrogenase [Deltaproteobacteria bacterium]
MELAMVGLGKMGFNMAKRLLGGGHRIVAYDLAEKTIKAAEKEGAAGARTLNEITQMLPCPRVVWVMVPSGDPTEDIIFTLATALSAGDIIIDGGNSNYKDSMRRARMIKAMDLHFIDVGTSGGIRGLNEGYSLMIGGEKKIVKRLRPVFETLAPAPDKGWGHVGPCGAGHFVKMVHNGIEYGLMEAYAEGFDIMKAKGEFGLDMHQIAQIWRHGSVVRSWLLDLTAEAFAQDQDLEGMEAWVADSGEGRWSVAEAIEKDVPAPVITLALEMRLVSRHKDSYAAKVIAAMRNKFGGHAVRKSHE